MCDDPVVREIPVYLSIDLAAQLCLVQHPTRPGEPLDPWSARIRPKHGKLELGVPIPGARHFGVEATDDLEEGFPHYDHAAPDRNRILEHRMNSSMMAAKAHYALGAMRDGHLHITSVRRIMQMRAGFGHVDRADTEQKAHEFDLEDAKSNVSDSSFSLLPAALRPASTSVRRGVEREGRDGDGDGGSVGVKVKKATPGNAYGGTRKYGRGGLLAAQTGYRKRESERAMAARLNSWAHQHQAEISEPFVELAVHTANSSEAEAAFERMFFTQQHSKPCAATSVYARSLDMSSASRQDEENGSQSYTDVSLRFSRIELGDLLRIGVVGLSRSADAATSAVIAEGSGALPRIGSGRAGGILEGSVVASLDLGNRGEEIEAALRPNSTSSVTSLPIPVARRHRLPVGLRLLPRATLEWLLLAVRSASQERGPVVSTDILEAMGASLVCAGTWCSSRTSDNNEGSISAEVTGTFLDAKASFPASSASAGRKDQTANPASPNCAIAPMQAASEALLWFRRFRSWNMSPFCGSTKYCYVGSDASKKMVILNTPAAAAGTAASASINDPFLRASTSVDNIYRIMGNHLKAPGNPHSLSPGSKGLDNLSAFPIEVVGCGGGSCGNNDESSSVILEAVAVLSRATRTNSALNELYTLREVRQLHPNMLDEWINGADLEVPFETTFKPFKDLRRKSGRDAVVGNQQIVSILRKAIVVPFAVVSSLLLKEVPRRSNRSWNTLACKRTPRCVGSTSCVREIEVLDVRSVGVAGLAAMQVDGAESCSAEIELTGEMLKLGGSMVRADGDFNQDVRCVGKKAATRAAPTTTVCCRGHPGTHPHHKLTVQERALVAALSRHANVVRGKWVASSHLLYSIAGATAAATGSATVQRDGMSGVELPLTRGEQLVCDARDTILALLERDEWVFRVPLTQALTPLPAKQVRVLNSFEA